jgi:hypothetical protein
MYHTLSKMKRFNTSANGMKWPANGKSPSLNELGLIDAKDPDGQMLVGVPPSILNVRQA